MTNLRIRIVNSKFITDTEVEEVSTPEQAQAIGIKGTIAMITDDIAGGATMAAATVMVSDDEEMLSYVAVSIGVAQLCKG